MASVIAGVGAITGLACAENGLKTNARGFMSDSIIGTIDYERKLRQELY